MIRDDQLEDGVYIDLPFEQYIIQRGRMGSGAKHTLHAHGPGYWWRSPMNPFYTESKSDAMLNGAALHALLLEGMHAYETRFVVEPDKRQYPGALFTIPQIKEAMAEAGVSIRGSSAYRLEDWADAASTYLPEKIVWANVLADFNAARGDREAIDAETDFNLRAMYDAAMDDHPDNADVRDVLGVGLKFPVLAEVSVFYTDEYGRHRARFDKMLPVATVDLKSVGAWTGRPLETMVDGLIKRNGYDIQRADYDIARRIGMKMILDDESKLHGGTPEGRTHMLAMAHYDQTHRPGWGWLFYGKPETTGRAPVLFPLFDPWDGYYHRSGFRKRAKALMLYQELMARFGPDRPWSKVHPLHFAVESHTPTINHEAWGDDVTPVPGEAEFFMDGQD